MLRAKFYLDLLLQHLGLIRSSENDESHDQQFNKIVQYFVSLTRTPSTISLSLKHLNGLTKIPSKEVPNPVNEHPFLSIDHRENLSGKT